MRSGELLRSLLLRVLEERGLLGIRNLDLKMNVLGVAADFYMLNLRISSSNSLHNVTALFSFVRKKRRSCVN